MDLQKHAPVQDAAARSTAPRTSELRASDADRDRVADMLREALAEGRLTADEHAERVEGVLAAKTVGELDVFVRDLPAAHRDRGPAAPAPNRPTAGAVPLEADENVVAVFSSAVRKGRWRANRRIHAYAVFGSVEVRVPENVSLRGTGGGVLGNFEVHTLDSSEPDAPVVYVDGWAVLGHVEARPKRGRVVADLLDRVHRRVEKGLRKHL
ncbi:DUF1707 SHOCT-like domain-containing protein [Streptomyces olivaceus]|uniref:DUF1707 SHOCT-like domain-containing protein n=1 Tax=Streptomyces olivaceus TaxID=47716 RepID=UPI0018849EEA|nr:DUF1707 domain-containing protein [Streptomyces olivaceus]